MILLYADDMAMCSDTVGRIQKRIDVLGQFCEKWAMIVNLTKTKIVVFRRGECLKQNEKWYYNGGKIKVVPSYKYLGIFFTSKLKWSQDIFSKLCSILCSALPSLFINIFVNN